MIELITAIIILIMCATMATFIFVSISIVITGSTDLIKTYNFICFWTILSAVCSYAILMLIKAR